MSNFAISAQLILQNGISFTSALLICIDYILQLFIPLLKWAFQVLWLVFQILLVPVYFTFVILSVPLRMMFVGFKLLLVVILLLIIFPLVTFDVLMQYLQASIARTRINSP